jgi:hypothetical protein
MNPDLKMVDGEATILRNLRIKPGKVDDFFEIWPETVRLRRKLGFEPIFACLDPNTNIVSYCFRFRGNFKEASERYYALPERARLERIADYVADWNEALVDLIDIPT